MLESEDIGKTDPASCLRSQRCGTCRALLCHDGRGHLDSINRWGYYTTRKQAWGMASFMSRSLPLPIASGIFGGLQLLNISIASCFGPAPSRNPAARQ